MVRPYRLPEPKGIPAKALGERLAAYFRRTWSGRVLIVTLLVLLFAHLLPLPELLLRTAEVVFAIFLLSWTVRLARAIAQRLFFRIRTKLLVSYFFIGFVPIVLLSVFFVIVELIAIELISSYMVASRLDRIADELKSEAALALAAAPLEDARIGPHLEQHFRPREGSHRQVSYALFRKGRLVARKGEAPAELPSWIPKEGFAGLTEEELRVRAVAVAGDLALVIGRPADEGLSRELEEATGIRVLWRGHTIDAPEPSPSPGAPSPDPKLQEERDNSLGGFGGFEWTDWGTGKTKTKFLAIRFSPPAVFRRLSPRSLDTGDTFVTVLLVVGGLFLVVYGVALSLGLLLAWSITGSVHSLSRGTLRLRNGDFTHPIRVRSRDQLGELAESFNMMVQGIQDLLREQAEKERLEEELRIARQIQMSLLPEGSLALSGLRIDALCLPAAEVGGDYYDLLPLSETRMGVLVADVSGKGTSAALYMAELKGLVLSLSQIYDSPRRLLSEANRILTAHLDSRSFVTMTYAVVDTEARVMRFARAGHNPVIHFVARTGETRVLAPQGLGLGIDPGERFDQILEESEVPLEKGDVFCLYTDGVSEAMNPGAELFGERRLRDLIERVGPGGEEPARLRERILEGIREFAQGAAQHDDMTLVVLKVV
jgi:serine phosphatase RsbU (regulator of sigma subunit)